MVKFKFFAIMSLTALTLGHNLNAQNMDTLDLKEQKIASIAANTAVGNLPALRLEIAAGLDAGLTVNQIKEVLVQLYAYCGFPRSLQALNTFIAVMEDRQAAGTDDQAGPDASPVNDSRDKYTRGKETLQTLTGVIETSPSGANAFAPAIDVFLKEHLFADIFERDILTYRQRETATIAALSALEGVQPMLSSHVNIGRNIGMSDLQLEHIVEQGRRIGNDFRGAFPLGQRADGRWFTGEVHVEGLVDAPEMENLYTVGQVTFSPGARTHWHTHPIGQTLLVTDGEGWYQERGKAAVKLQKGSVVAIPKDVDHWHGASRDSRLVHIAISNISSGTNVSWGRPVTAEDYDSVERL